MIDILAEGVPMRDLATLPVTYPDDAPPGNDYYLSCKYQIDLSGAPCLFRLMILRRRSNPIWYFFKRFIHNDGGLMQKCAQAPIGN
jgi:hypothetical protein